MDRISKKRRSWNMSRIRGADTSVEREVRSLLHGLGYRFRIHRKDLPGKPDVVLPRYRTIVFVHGCFWHRHPNCKYAYMPKTRLGFWQAKFRRNVARDKEVARELRKLGWRVMVVWECQLRDKAKLRRRLLSALPRG